MIRVKNLFWQNHATLSTINIILGNSVFIHFWDLTIVIVIYIVKFILDITPS